MTTCTRFAIVIGGEYLRHSKAFSYRDGNHDVTTTDFSSAHLFTKRRDADHAARYNSGEVVPVVCVPGGDADMATLASCYLSLMEGDTHRIDEAYEVLKRRGFCDEHGFPTGEGE